MRGYLGHRLPFGILSGNRIYLSSLFAVFSGSGLWCVSLGQARVTVKSCHNPVHQPSAHAHQRWAD